jgi:hypothetical protein
MSLSEADIEAVALRVAALLQGNPGSAELVDAAEIARRFGVSRDFVYDHADDLGVVRLGEGPRARLRFDPTWVRRQLGTVATPPSPKTRPPQRHSERTLLPVRGRGEA